VIQSLMTTLQEVAEKMIWSRIFQQSCSVYHHFRVIACQNISPDFFCIFVWWSLHNIMRQSSYCSHLRFTLLPTVVKQDGTIYFNNLLDTWISHVCLNTWLPSPHGLDWYQLYLKGCIIDNMCATEIQDNGNLTTFW
jgi:hypothetical protein